MIGPPRLAVDCCLLYQSGGIRCLLLDHELALSAELRMFQVAAPWNWFVPDRVRI